jgi:hypothetical protein
MFGERALRARSIMFVRVDVIRVTKAATVRQIPTARRPW